MRSSSRRVGDVLVLLALALGVGCGVWWVTARLAYPSRAYASTPAAVQAQCEDARTFEGFFPSAEACLSYFDGSAGVPEWKCEFKSPEVEIIATMPLDVDRREHAVAGCGPMRIDVLIVEKVEALPDGQARTSYADHRTFTASEFFGLVGTDAGEDARIKRLIGR